MMSTRKSCKPHDLMNTNGEGSSSLKSHFKVVVVGGGIAGVTAVAKLLHNGIKDVIVLEAQDYIGGRIKSVSIDNTFVDLGAGYIHGQEGNPIYDIAKKRDIIINQRCPDEFQERLCNTPKSFLSTDGRKIPFDEALELILSIEKFKKHQTTVHVEEDVTEGDVYDGTFHDFVQNYGEEMDASKKEFFTAVFRWYCSYLKTDEGVASLYDTCAWGLSEYAVLKGNRYTEVYGGIGAILQTILDLIPDEIIHTDVPVKCINWDDVSINDGKVVIQCENGDVITADHVIITVSIGCLQAKHSSMFRPPLPDDFLKAMRGIHFGAINKVYLRFDKPFWGSEEGDEKIHDFLWIKPYPQTLKADKSKRKTKFGKPWWHDIFSCERLFERKDTLLIWFMKDQAEVIEDLDDDEVMAVLREMLQIFFFDRYIPEPSAIYRDVWLKNPYIRGTYSCPGRSIRRRDVEHLTKPTFPSIKNPRMLFAGEAFSFEHMSTVHSAFITAEYQAERILAANGIHDTTNVVDMISPVRSV